MGVLNGLLLTPGKVAVWAKPTVDLGRNVTYVNESEMNDNMPTSNRFSYVGVQGKMYYCDGNYIGEIFATTSLVTNGPNIQSVCSYTSSSALGTVSTIISGSLPYIQVGARVPVVFFTDVYGTQPANLTPGVVYYVEIDPVSGVFSVYATDTSTSAIDIATGAGGKSVFYFLLAFRCI